MSKLIIVSNRLPISVRVEENEFVYSQSAGGLATGLSSFHHPKKDLWIGWAGCEIEQEKDQEKLTKTLRKEGLVPIFMSNQEIEDFYEGFSNKTIWPLFHYFKQYTEYNPNYWKVYQNINQRFCDTILEYAKPDDTIWVHDYQLMLLPQMLRKKLPSATIGFFLHIPFPSYELFRTLPWRKEIVEGLLGSDLIGFHTFDYVRHFISTSSKIIGHENRLGHVQYNSRIVDIDAFPMGIDYNKFSQSMFKPETIREVINLRNQLGQHKLILSIDRLDYSKGIVQRLEAFDVFLEKYPEYRGKVSLITVTVPSRAKVEHYQTLKQNIDETVGRINGKYSTPGWTAIHYFYRSLNFETLTALYYTSDIALITPFRDGMNLIAKEYVAGKIDGNGVLILSETAGAAKELTEAIHINPNDVQGIAEAIKEAIEIPDEEKKSRIEAMQVKLKRYNVVNWAQLFLKRLDNVRKLNYEKQQKYWNEKYQEELLNAYRKAKKRLILLDYDGTLVNFTKEPNKAFPNDYLLHLLEQLTKNTENNVVIISGRDRNTLWQWLGHLNLDFIAEHGIWYKQKNQEWEMADGITDDWKPRLREILEAYVDRTPGSFVEEKQYSLAWHYRNLDVDIASMRRMEILEALTAMAGEYGLSIMDGNKVIEIKNKNVNKGKATQKWLSKNEWDFVLAIGDDITDEDTFRALDKEKHFSIKVGFQETEARYNMKDVAEVHNLLEKMIEQL